MGLSLPPPEDREAIDVDALPSNDILFERLAGDRSAIITLLGPPPPSLSAALLGDN